jgi:hypothetical protein
MLRLGGVSRSASAKWALVLAAGSRCDPWDTWSASTMSRGDAIQPELWVNRADNAIAFSEAALGARLLHRAGEGEDVVAQLAIGDTAFWVATASSVMKRYSARPRPTLGSSHVGKGGRTSPAPRLAFPLFIGNHFMAADHGARSRADVLELTLRRLLAQR